MATIAELKKQITDAFMSNETLMNAYGLSTSDSFDDKFSKVSFESVLFYVVAFCHKLIYDIVDVFKAEQQAAIDAAYIANDRWWYNQVMTYVFGAALIYDEKTYKFSPSIIEGSTPLCAYCSIRQAVNANEVTYVKVMASKKAYAVLSIGEKTAMTEYLKRVAPAGVIFEIESNTPDVIYFPLSGETAGIQIYYDPMLVDSTGTLLSDGQTQPVNDAIAAYINGIVYGGRFNVTKLIDAIQSAVGVVDVKINTCKIHKYSDASGVGSVVTTTVDLAAGVGKFDIADETYVSTIGYFPQSAL